MIELGCRAALVAEAGVGEVVGTVTKMKVERVEDDGSMRTD